MKISKITMFHHHLGNMRFFSNRLKQIYDKEYQDASDPSPN